MWGALGAECYVMLCGVAYLSSVVDARCRCTALGLARAGLVHRVGVGFPEGAKLLHVYTEFLECPNFYTFTNLTHFPPARYARPVLVKSKNI